MPVVRERARLVYVPVDKLVPNQWNPNEEDADTFNRLAESIEEVGFVDPVDVFPKDPKWEEHLEEHVDAETGERYWVYTGPGPIEVIHGEHRARAAKYVGLEHVPCLFHPDWDEDLRKFMSVRMNVLRGRINPAKFLNLVGELRKKYRDEVIQHMMGFVKGDEFQKLVGQVKRSLPKEVADKLDEVDEEIESIEELSEALNRLFREYGKTLPYSFMFFTWGGRVHLMVRMSDSLKDRMKKLAEECVKEGIDLAEELERRLFGDGSVGREAG